MWRVLVRGIGYALVGWLLAALTPPADSAPIAVAGRAVAGRWSLSSGSACPVSVTGVLAVGAMSAALAEARR